MDIDKTIYVCYTGLMTLKPLTTKLEGSQIKALKALSEKTRIPQSELIREGVKFILRRHREDALSEEFKAEIESLLKEDLRVLKRLA